MFVTGEAITHIRQRHGSNIIPVPIVNTIALVDLSEWCLTKNWSEAEAKLQHNTDGIEIPMYQQFSRSGDSGRLVLALGSSRTAFDRNQRDALVCVVGAAASSEVQALAPPAEEHLAGDLNDEYLPDGNGFDEGRIHIVITHLIMQMTMNMIVLQVYYA
jgi:hypothetical protein